MDNTEIIYGRNPVIEVARGRRDVYEILLMDSTNKAIGHDLRKLGYSPKVVSRGKIGNMTKRSDHQGAAAIVSPFEYSEIDALREIKSGIIIAADGITDERNLGAVIRSAVLLGAGGVIIPVKGSASVSPVVTHTSAGATEHIAISKVKSLPHELSILKERGFQIAAAVMPDEGTVDIRKFQTPDKTVLVIGDEGYGISGKVMSKCEVKLSIPQRSSFDSYNVSVATSIILYELLRDRI